MDDRTDFFAPEKHKVSPTKPGLPMSVPKHQKMTFINLMEVIRLLNLNNEILKSKLPVRADIA